MTRSLYTLLETRSSWGDVLELIAEASQELKFWEACLSDYVSTHMAFSIGCQGGVF